MEKKIRENALLIIEREGSCTGIRCEYCPLYNKKTGIFACSKYVIDNRVSITEIHKNVKELCFKFLNSSGLQLEFNFKNA